MAEAKERKFARNLLEQHVSVRLKESDKRIELAPRGQRGDVALLKGAEQIDEATDDQNHGLLYEIISEEDRNEIVAKQSTNQQAKSSHPAFQTLRNELGEEYEEGAVTREPEPADRGRTVAHLDEVAEGVGNIIVDRGVGIRRAEIPGTQDNPLPDVPDSISPEEQAEYRLEEARKTAEATQPPEDATEGPQAGLPEGVKITLEPVQKS
jgi:hypothetical protein